MLYYVVLCHFENIGNLGLPYLTQLFVIPGGLLLPCDFEHGFCQWYHSSDSDFQWQRNQGPTPSYNTGPDADHTTGSGSFALQ